MPPQLLPRDPDPKPDPRPELRPDPEPEPRPELGPKLEPRPKPAPLLERVPLPPAGMAREEGEEVKCYFWCRERESA